jgi:hypothetical protein
MMAAQVDLTIIAETLSLGKNPKFIDKATDGTTPDTYVEHMPTLAVADTDEVLDVGDIATAQLLVIRAIDYDLDIDLDYVSSFDADLTVEAGGPAAAIPNPAGIIRVKNGSAGETPQFEYLLIGTT